jgi:nucleotide-binding universal stress UspA family protein
MAVVVAAIDLRSPMSEAVLEAARHEVEVSRARQLHVVHVLQLQASPVEVPFSPEYEPGMDAPIAKARAEIEQMCRRTRHAQPSEITVHVRVGDVTEEICALAEEVGADVIVVGTLGRHGLSRILHGSTAARLIRHAPCSVFTVHQPTAAA